MAQRVQARAYTVGHNVVLGANAPSLQSRDGWLLLAHELAHVVQQRGGGPGPTEADSDAELEADTAATTISEGNGFAVHGQTGITLARQGPGTPPTTSPLTLPAEGVNMPWVGKGGLPSSELGYLRDSNYFWSHFQNAYGDRLSLANRTRIASGQAPIVNATWVQHYPQHAAYLGETLEHHHVGQGSRAVPLPETLHDAYTVFHPQRRVVGTPTGGTRALPPQPTRQHTEAEISRHVTEGHIRGPGITPGSPPSAPAVPASSEVAALPPAATHAASAHPAAPAHAAPVHTPAPAHPAAPAHAAPVHTPAPAHPAAAPAHAAPVHTPAPAHPAAAPAHAAPVHTPAPAHPAAAPAHAAPVHTPAPAHPAAPAHAAPVHTPAPAHPAAPAHAAPVHTPAPAHPAAPAHAAPVHTPAPAHPAAAPTAASVPAHPTLHTAPPAHFGEEMAFGAADAAGELLTFIGGQYVQGELDEMSDQKRREELAKLQPEIERRLEAKQDVARMFQAAGIPVFANLTLREWYQADDQGFSAFFRMDLVNVDITILNVQDSYAEQYRPDSVWGAVKGFLQAEVGGQLSYRNTSSWELLPQKPKAP